MIVENFNPLNLFIFMPILPTIGSRGIVLSGCLSVVRPSVNTCFAWHDISVLSGGISVKLRTNIRLVSIKYEKGFQGQRSKVKVIASRNPLYRWVISIDFRPSVRCPSGGGMQIDGMASRFICFRLLSYITVWFLAKPRCHCVAPVYYMS